MDEATAQTFKELQQKFIQLTREKDQIAVQIRHHQTAIKKALLTADELKGVPESCRMYQQIGRGYFLAPKAELMLELKDLQQERNENVKLLKERHSKMEEAYKSTENELKELLQQNPGLPRAVMNSQQEHR